MERTALLPLTGHRTPPVPSVPTAADPEPRGEAPSKTANVLHSSETQQLFLKAARYQMKYQEHISTVDLIRNLIKLAKQQIKKNKDYECVYAGFQIPSVEMGRECSANGCLDIESKR